MANNPTHAEVSQLHEASAAPDPAAELASAQEEVLRLRDLLIARDAELGAAKGKVMELEVRSMQLVGAAARVRALLPRFLVRILKGLRRARG
jgi:hypothetical protein